MDATRAGQVLLAVKKTWPNFKTVWSLDEDMYGDATN
jgi:hypothetical protein